MAVLTILPDRCCHKYELSSLFSPSRYFPNVMSELNPKSRTYYPYSAFCTHHSCSTCYIVSSTFLNVSGQFRAIRHITSLLGVFCTNIECVIENIRLFTLKTIPFSPLFMAILVEIVNYFRSTVIFITV